MITIIIKAAATVLCSKWYYFKFTNHPSGSHVFKASTVSTSTIFLLKFRIDGAIGEDSIFYDWGSSQHMKQVPLVPCLTMFFILINIKKSIQCIDSLLFSYEMSQYVMNYFCQSELVNWIMIPYSRWWMCSRAVKIIVTTVLYFPFLLLQEGNKNATATTNWFGKNLLDAAHSPLLCMNTNDKQ